MTEQELTNKIIKNAEQEAANLIAAAQNEANSKIEQAKQEAAQRQETALKQAKQDLNQREAQLEKANEVEMIKARINARQAMVTAAFDQVRDQLLHAKDAEIKKMVNGLIKAYATPKDTILISHVWAKAMPELKPTPAIEGGIIIENQTYRIELSLDVLLRELRDKIELDVARILGVI